MIDKIGGLIVGTGTSGRQGSSSGISLFMDARDCLLRNFDLCCLLEKAWVSPIKLDGWQLHHAVHCVGLGQQ